MSYVVTFSRGIMFGRDQGHPVDALKFCKNIETARLARDTAPKEASGGWKKPRIWMLVDIDDAL